MEFRFNMTVEVDEADRGMATRKPVPMQLIYQAGRWRAQSENPPVSTCFVETLEEAMVTGAKEVTAELRAQV